MAQPPLILAGTAHQLAYHALQGSASSSLPTFTLKSPASSSSSSSSSSSGSFEQPPTQGQICSCLPSANYGPGVILSLGGKGGRQGGIRAWTTDREQLVARLIPPVVVSVMALDKSSGRWLALGTADGRVLFYDFPTGTLLVSLDAHLRAVTSLTFTPCSSALLSSSADGTVAVYQLSSLLASAAQQQGQQQAKEYARLKDHTLAVNCVALGPGSRWREARVYTGSEDGTVKVWDLRSPSSHAALVSTFMMPMPVTHLAVEPLERAFYAALRAPQQQKQQQKGRVVRVALYERFGEQGTSTRARGGGERGESTRIDLGREADEYLAPAPITALSVSAHAQAPILLLGLSTSLVQVLALPSLVVLRSFSLLPPNTTTTTTTTEQHQEPVLHVELVERPVGLGKGREVEGRVPKMLGRAVVVQPAAQGEWRDQEAVAVKLGRAPNVEDMFDLSLLPSFPGRSATIPVTGFAESHAGVGSDGDQEELQRLREEVVRLKEGLERAGKVNEGLVGLLMDTTSTQKEVLA